MERGFQSTLGYMAQSKEMKTVGGGQDLVGGH